MSDDSPESLPQASPFRSAKLLRDAMGTASVTEVNGYQCAGCHESRRVELTLLYPHYGIRSEPRTLSSNMVAGDEPPPVLMSLRCLQCQSDAVVLLYKGRDGESVAILTDTYGGLTTEHTPEAVSYYLDQAALAESVGANSAAVAMYRAALEHVLFEQGFQDLNCGAKLRALNKAIDDDTAPAWASVLEVEWLDLIKTLGDGAVHPNNGDIRSQALLDDNLLQTVRGLLVSLLYLVYDQPKEMDRRLGSMRFAGHSLKKPKKKPTP